jgi:hypothetical protein
MLIKGAKAWVDSCSSEVFDLKTGLRNRLKDIEHMNQPNAQEGESLPQGSGGACAE